MKPYIPSPLILLPIVFLLALSSCSSIEIFKENSEIAPYKPFQSFVIINQEVGMRGFDSQFTDHQVQIRLQQVLEAQGLTYDNTEPDLVIRYTSNEDTRQKEVYNNMRPFPMWGYRVWDPWLYNPYFDNRNFGPRTSNYELVQVIVDFIDPKKDKFLMTLTGVTEVTSEKAKNKKILKTTDKIVNRFLAEIQPSQ